MNLLQLSSFLSFALFALSNLNHPRHSIRSSQVLTRSVEYQSLQPSSQSSQHRRHYDCLDTEILCPLQPDQPPTAVGYLENCLNAAEGLVAEDNHVPDFGCGNCFLFVNSKSTGNESVYSSSMTADLLKKFIGQVMGSGILGCNLSTGHRDPPETNYPDGDNDIYIWFSTEIPLNATECGRPDRHLNSGE